MSYNILKKYFTISLLMLFCFCFAENHSADSKINSLEEVAINKRLHGKKNTPGLNPALTQIKVACVGNSITAGYGLDSVSERYPTQLNALLGNNYVVRNFGRSGATLLTHGDVPYIEQFQYTAALNFNPDIVVIKLGTNDSKSQNWNPYSSEFMADYEAMIDAFKNLASHPKIFIALPTKAFNDSFGISENNLVNGIRPYIIQVANKKGVSVIDIYDATKNYPNNFPDGIHPTAAGSRRIAEKVRDVLVVPQPDVNLNEYTITAPTAYGYQWFKNGLKIEGAIQQNLTVYDAGSYSVLVKVNDNNEDRVISNPVTVVNNGNLPPSRPYNLSALPLNAQVSLNWQPGYNNETYNIKRANSVNGPFVNINSSVNGTSYADNDVQNGITYYYIVSAANEVAESPDSDIVSATPYNTDLILDTSLVYNIFSVNSGKVLDIAVPSVANGVKIKMADSSDVNNKKWRFVATQNGYYKIDNMLSLKSLSIAGNPAVNNAEIQQLDYLERASQQWRLEDAGNGMIRIYSEASNKLLDAGTGQIGQIIFQSDGDGTDGQLWRLEPTTLSVAGIDQDQGYTIYPSPAKSFLYVISTSAEKISEIRIYNTLGLLVYTKENITDEITQIPVSQFATGVYTVIAGSSKGKKVIIAN